MNYYKHYMGDYQRDTGHLSLAQDGAYRRLIDHYYSTEQPLPADAAALYRICGAMDKKEREAVLFVAESFFTVGADCKLHHNRINTEIEKAQEKIANLKANASNGGKKSGETRRSKSEANASINDEANASANAQADANNTNNQYPLKTKAPNPAEAGPTAKPRVSGIALQTFLADCKTKGERPLRDYQPLWAYAKGAGLHADFVALAWAEFCRRFLPGGAKEGRLQKDWRKTFRNYVENNYFKLWAIDKDGNYFLTTQGKQAEKFQESRAAA